MGGQQVAALPVDVTVLDSLPGARRLERDERVFAGCSALVALEEVCSQPPHCNASCTCSKRENVACAWLTRRPSRPVMVSLFGAQSEVLLPARIVEVWDGAYVHVDYAAHGIGRLDEIVEAVRLAAVVQFVPGSPPKSAEPSPTKISEGTLDEQLGEKVLAQELDQPVQPDPAVAQQDDWKAYAEDFRKTRTGHLLDQKQQELQRLQMMLQHQKQCLEHAVRLQFTVDEDLLGLAVGAKGANLWSARQIEGVLSVDIDGNEVQVVAASDEAGQAARDVLEYLREAVPIQPHEGRLLIGRGGKNIRDLQTKCQLFSIKVAETHVDLVGSRKAVILAKRGIELVVRFMSHEESLAHDTQGLIKEVKAIPFGLLLENQNADGQDETLWREINNALAAPHARAGAGAKEEMPCFELTVPADKVGLIIGVKGAMIKEISEASRCRITVDKALDKALGGGSERSRSDMDARSGIDATLSTLIIQPLPAGVPLPGTGSEGNRDRLPAGDEKLAVKLINGCIDERARTIKQGLFPGAVLRVRVEKTVDFGAFVLLPNGKEGLLHISELDHEHVVAVTDYVHVGEAIHVVVLSVDERGRARLSLKDVDQESGVFLGQLPQIEYPQSLASFPGLCLYMRLLRL